MKKYMFIINLMFVFISLANAQMMDIKASSLSKMEVYHIYGKIHIQGTSENRIMIEVVKKNPVPKEFESLDDNDYKKSNSNLDLYIKERGNTLSIYPSTKEAKFSDYLIKIPKALAIKINIELGGITNKDGEIDMSELGAIFIDNMTNEIEVEGFSSNLTATNVSGPIVANIFSGNIKITFKGFNQTLPSSIETFSGNINVYLPSDINCNVKLHSFSGNVNSEFDISDVKISYSQNDVRMKSIKGGNGINKQQVNNAKINGKINKGGAELNLGAFSGNINLLKTNQ